MKKGRIREDPPFSVSVAPGHARRAQRRNEKPPGMAWRYRDDDQLLFFAASCAASAALNSSKVCPFSLASACAASRSASE